MSEKKTEENTEEENIYCIDDSCEIGNVFYTCPMHPEIIRDEPGDCPKCGMHLEPITVQAEEKSEELDDISRRFWISTVLSIPLFALAMVHDITPQYIPSWLSAQMVQWIQFFLATPVVLCGGWPFYVKGYQSVKTWNLNMFTLISMGVGAAYI